MQTLPTPTAHHADIADTAALLRDLVRLTKYLLLVDGLGLLASLVVLAIVLYGVVLGGA